MGFDGGGPDLERLREFNVDRTPTPAVGQMLQFLHDHVQRRMLRRVLDPAAGSGVFGMCGRRLWPAAKFYAVEARREEQAWLRRHYDNFSIELFQDYAKRAGERFDLVVTNPPFDQWESFLRCAIASASDDGIIALLGLNDWGQSAGGAAVFHAAPPAMQLRIPGRLNMRGPGINPHTEKPWGSDQRCYSWWIWRCGERPPMWQTTNLDLLAAHDREWRIEPGREAA